MIDSVICGAPTPPFFLGYQHRLYLCSPNATILYGILTPAFLHTYPVLLLSAVHSSVRLEYIDKGFPQAKWRTKRSDLTLALNLTLALTIALTQHHLPLWNPNATILYPSIHFYLLSHFISIYSFFLGRARVPATQHHLPLWNPNATNL